MNKQTHKQCTSCKRTKPLTDYYRMSHAPDGRESQCKDCRRAKVNRRHRERRDGLISFVTG